MKLSTRAEYGIRVLVALARAEGEGPVSLASVARRERLPHAYIEQLVADLRRASLVTATRGKAGGYALARPASEISLVDAVRALDGPLLEMPCAGPDNLEVCARPQDCSVHDVFVRMHDSLEVSLAGTSLAEVAATAGGPPYPIEVRRRIAARHAAQSATRPTTTAPTQT
ncbi:MAG TPA: Rrf2 family transcriptional regulator [candidate division Zixibacteria bacterium]|nr:Rrf2 family transcriptional regulator [candidate division Zixibacteria bacterium]